MNSDVVAKDVVAKDVVAKDVVAKDVVAKDVGAKDVVAKDNGQATVELALALPLLCLLLLGMVQVAVIGRGQLAVQLAAHEAARAAAVSANPESAARTAAHHAISLRPLSVTVEVDEATITVTVSYVDHTDLSMTGALLPDVTLQASATMAFEPP